MKIAFAVEKTEEGATLAALVRGRAPALSWSRARALVERGKVTVDGERVLDPARRCRAGEAIALDEAAPLVKPEVRAPIVFEDAHLVVIDKPTGVSSVPYEEREIGTAMDLLRDTWRIEGRGKRGGPKANEVALHVVHRIDKDTSGLLCFAKSKTAERAIGALFRAHDVERLYRCVAHGRMVDRRIESALVTDRGDGLRGTTHAPGKGKRAVTHVRALEALAAATLCEVRLETGKTHQIRIHLAEAGHPLVGERVYIRDFTARGGDLLPSPRLLLHAATLGFRHPVTGETISLESPLPPDFTEPLAALRRGR